MTPYGSDTRVVQILQAAPASVVQYAPLRQRARSLSGASFCRVSVRYVSEFCRGVLARTRNDRGEVEPVRRTMASLVLLDSGRTSLEESGSSHAVTAGGMRQADADLRETLPQIAFLVRTSLPAGLQDLMRSEGPAFLHEPPSQV